MIDAVKNEKRQIKCKKKFVKKILQCCAEIIELNEANDMFCQYLIL